MTSSVCCYDGELLSLVATFQMRYARGSSSKGRLAPAGSHSAKPGFFFGLVLSQPIRVSIVPFPVE
jgi:hypothetical protein